ncbi:ROK family protein [Streptomyces sp. NPDC093085]|uniref:ROK family protein n=1 Tax=Streptomyces sp. NPDC093085 TaxID=3155068 RepID=UPI00341ACDBE
MKALAIPGPVVAVDIGGTKTALLVADGTDGAAPRTDRIPTLPDEGPIPLFARIAEAVDTLLGPEADRADVTGVGLVCPGIATETGVLYAPHTPGWEELRVREVTGALFPGARVAVMNDVKAAALAEARQGLLAGAGHGIYLNVGTGLSCALVVDGTVLTGANGAAGEIGYQAAHPAEPGVREDRAPLEETFSGAALTALARAAAEEEGKGEGTGEDAGAGEGATAGTAFERAATDGAFGKEVGERMERFALAVANLAIAFDPARIVVGGGMARHDEVFTALTAALERYVPFPPELLRSRTYDDAALTGALIAAREAPGPGP